MFNMLREKKLNVQLGSDYDACINANFITDLSEKGELKCD